MYLLIAIISILAITGVVRLTNKFLGFKICPVCAGVAGTWLGIIALRSLGYSIDPVMLAILLGGSVVGLAYQVEKRLPASFSPLLWKIIFIPAGFIAAYGLVQSQWFTFWIAFVFLLGLSLFALVSKTKSAPESKAAEELEETMKECC